MTAGIFKTYEVTIENGVAGELDISSIRGIKEVLVNPGAANVRVLITPDSSTEAATASSFLLPNGEATEFELGTGLDRLSFYNGSGGQVKVSVAVLY